ncbi:MAG: 30S ribosomal protein S17 [Lysobacteraceae bacterium]
MTDTDKKQRTIEGRVVSSKMQKTVTVLVERQIKHGLYGKYISAPPSCTHDEQGCQEGDVVRVAECRPVSKTKNWRVEVVSRAAGG